MLSFSISVKHLITCFSMFLYYMPRCRTEVAQVVCCEGDPNDSKLSRKVLPINLADTVRSVQRSQSFCTYNGPRKKSSLHRTPLLSRLMLYEPCPRSRTAVQASRRPKCVIVWIPPRTVAQLCSAAVPSSHPHLFQGHRFHERARRSPHRRHPAHP